MKQFKHTTQTTRLKSVWCVETSAFFAVSSACPLWALTTTGLFIAQGFCAHLYLFPNMIVSITFTGDDLSDGPCREHQAQDWLEHKQRCVGRVVNRDEARQALYPEQIVFSLRGAHMVREDVSFRSQMREMTEADLTAVMYIRAREDPGTRMGIRDGMPTDKFRYARWK